jgi:hypothetical protein
MLRDFSSGACRKRQRPWPEARTNWVTVRDDGNAGTIMTTHRFRVVSDLEGSQFTDLFACISEEDDGYTVQVRLYDQTKPENAAWGEEITDSVETASMLVAALATEFSIPQARIKIEIRMNNMTDGTRH